ncbi:hypothetical protein CASP1_00077 [Alcaligenes phage CASP1]|nr:hypothetical protein CASP1_00077 [Alcaligenes phage CASP1]
MADITDYVNIDQLPPAENIFGNELLEVLQAGNNHRATVIQLSEPAFDRIGAISLNVKNFGAVGDGSTDDRAAIQAAVDAAAIENVPLIFPNGRYLISNRISLRSNSHIYANGDATIESSADYQSGVASLMYGSAKNNVKISGLKFDTSRGYYTGHIWLANCTDVTIDKCNFISDWSKSTGSIRYGTHINGGSDISITGSFFDGIARPIWVIGSGKRIRIDDNRLQNMRSFGIIFSESTLFWEGVRIRGNYIDGYGSQSSLIYIGALAGNSALTGYHTDLVVADNFGLGSDLPYVTDGDLRGNGDLFSLRAMENARVYGNYVLNGGDLGLVIEYSKNVTVSGNIAARNEISGIVLHKAENVTLVNNICYDNCLDRSGRATLLSERGGIRVMAGSLNAVIVGNRCYDTRASGKTQLWGIVVTTQDQGSVGQNTGRVYVGTNMLSGNRIGGVFWNPNLQLQPSLDFEIAVSGATPNEMWARNTVCRHTTVAQGLPFMSVVRAAGTAVTIDPAESGYDTVKLDDVSNITDLSKLAIQNSSGGVFFIGVSSVDYVNNTVKLSGAIPAPGIQAGATVFYTTWRTAVSYQ